MPKIRKTRTPEYKASLKRMTKKQARIILKYRKYMYYEAVRKAERVVKRKSKRRGARHGGILGEAADKLDRR